MEINFPHKSIIAYASYYIVLFINNETRIFGLDKNFFVCFYHHDYDFWINVCTIYILHASPYAVSFSNSQVLFDSSSIPLAAFALCRFNLLSS